MAGIEKNITDYSYPTLKEGKIRAFGIIGSGRNKDIIKRSWVFAVALFFTHTDIYHVHVL